MHKELEAEPHLAKSANPYSKNGSYTELKKVFAELQIKTKINAAQSEFIRTSTLENEVELNDLQIADGLVPNVTGMGLQDAVYILENKGIAVKVTGRGTVKKQSVAPGSKIERGTTIYLELS
jgi:cell division protein FtsI (penicillin-binding protein 3)